MQYKYSIEKNLIKFSVLFLLLIFGMLTLNLINKKSPVVPLFFLALLGLIWATIWIKTLTKIYFQNNELVIRYPLSGKILKGLLGLEPIGYSRGVYAEFSDHKKIKIFSNLDNYANFLSSLAEYYPYLNQYKIENGFIYENGPIRFSSSTLKTQFEINGHTLNVYKNHEISAFDMTKIEKVKYSKNLLRGTLRFNYAGKNNYFFGISYLDDFPFLLYLINKQ